MLIVLSRVKNKVRNHDQSKEATMLLNSSNSKQPPHQSYSEANLVREFWAIDLRAKNGEPKILTKSVKRLREN